MDRLKNTIKSVLDNKKAILSGLMDIIIVKHDDGTYKSTPFYVAFGSINYEKVHHQVKVKVNGKLKEVTMYIQKSGQLFFQKKKKVSISQQIKKHYASDSNLDSLSQSEWDDKSSNSESSTGSQSKKSKIKQLYNWQWECSANKITQQKFQNKLQELQQKQVVNQNIGSFRSYISSFFRSGDKNKKKNQTKAFKQDQKKQNSKFNIYNKNSIPEQFYQGQDTKNLDPSLMLSLCGNLINPNLPKSTVQKYFYNNRVTYKQFRQDPIALMNNQNLVVMIHDIIYTWQVAMAIIVSQLAFGKLDQKMIEKILEGKKGWFGSKKGLRIPFKQQKIKAHDDKNIKQAQTQKLRKLSQGSEEIRNFHKTKTPDNQTIKRLDLDFGKNSIQFILFDKQLKIQYTLSCQIYLWTSDTKIVVSDIDGTITKSDVLGQVMTMVNLQWVHPGVVQLFSKIYQNGYQLLYLTARAIGQSFQTKRFLTQFCRHSNFYQLDNLKLPPGPMLTSPDGLYHSFKRQVIEKKPQIMKIQMLTTIKNLFKKQRPIYSGFGNRDTDAIAYRSVGIKPQRSFITNQSSSIHIFNDSSFKSSYIMLWKQVDQIFPVIQAKQNQLKYFYRNKYWHFDQCTNKELNEFL